MRARFPTRIEKRPRNERRERGGGGVGCGGRFRLAHNTWAGTRHQEPEPGLDVLLETLLSFEALGDDHDWMFWEEVPKHHREEWLGAGADAAPGQSGPFVQ